MAPLAAPTDAEQAHLAELGAADLTELGAASTADLADVDPVQFDPGDSLVRSRRCPWLSYVPWYSAALSLALIPVFYSGASTAAFELDTEKPRQVWRVVTYAWFHYSPAHLWVNVATFLIYSGLVELENGWARAATLSQIGIVGGAFGVFWQRRFVATPYTVAGISGGVYGMLASQIGFMAAYWHTLHTVKRVVHLALLVGAVACDVAVTVYTAAQGGGPAVSYADHVAGFVTDAFASVFVLRTGRAGVPWLLPVCSGVVAACILVAGAVNVLVGF
jgi:membrane associated rhomboid family serine protease